MSVHNKSQVRAWMRAIAESTPAAVGRALADAYHPQVVWRGSHPLNEMTGIEAVEQRVWKPLLRSLPDLERRDVILIGGTSEGREYVGAVGHYAGTFRRDWLDIPATGRTLYLRYGEFHQVEAGRIVQSTVLLDVLDAIRQAGFRPIAPSLGVEEQWPCPISADGVVLTEQDPALSAASLELTLAMQRTLGAYRDRAGDSRENLLAMPQKDYWHPRMMWYGPCGIGTARGLEGFVDHHQLPFRIAFPNRKGVGHYVEIGDGKYSATAGWPSVQGHHAGGDWLGVGPTGRDVTMRVMDFYLAEDGLIRENWVPLDIIHVLLQMDVDVFARMRAHFWRTR